MKVNRIEYRWRVDAWDTKRGCYRRVYRSQRLSDAVHVATVRLRNARVIDQLTETRIR